MNGKTDKPSEEPIALTDVVAEDDGKASKSQPELIPGASMAKIPQIRGAIDELDIPITIENPIDGPDLTDELLEEPEPELTKAQKELGRQLNKHIESFAGVIQECRPLEDGIRAIILVDKERFSTFSDKTIEELEESVGKIHDGIRLVVMTEEGKLLKFGGEHFDKVNPDIIKSTFNWLKDKTIEDFRSQSTYTENTIVNQGAVKRSA